MPTTQQTLGALVPVGANIAKWLADRRASKNALGYTTAGVDAAGRQIDTATAEANRRAEAALTRNRTDYGTLGDRTRADYGTLGEQQRALYDTTAANNRGAQDLGNLSIEQLQEMIRNPEKFDSSSVATDPGYQFGLNEGLKGGDRAAQASGGLGNGGQRKAQTRYALDYATTKYDEALTRFRQGQQDKQSLYTGGATIGQQANAAVQNAGNTLGQQLSANTGAVAGQDANSVRDLAGQTASTAEYTGDRNILAANTKAGLTMKQAEDSAQNIGNQAENNSGLINTAAAAIPAIASLFGAGGAGAAAGTAGAGGSIAGMTAGFKTAMTALANSPALPIAAVVAAGAVWLKSQAKWEANTAVKDFENPFHQEFLAPFARQWEQSYRDGTLTQESGQAALTAYQENFDEYVRKIEAWAGNSKDKKKVAAQSIKNLLDNAVRQQIEGMSAAIPNLPAGEVQ